MMEEPAASDLQPVTENSYQLPKVLAEMIIILILILILILIQPAWKKKLKNLQNKLYFSNRRDIMKSWSIDESPFEAHPTKP